MRYRIVFQFSGLGGTVREEDGGYTEEAGSEEEALERAHRRGCGWGLGYDRSYIGARAVPEEAT